MDICEFVGANAVDFASRRIMRDDLKSAEDRLGVTFGPQLVEYLLEYGYLGFKSVEFYGMNAMQGLKSDMVAQTLYLHEHHALTGLYVALENLGDGAYALVDSKDAVFEFVSETNELVGTNRTLFDYVLDRFQTVS